MYELEALQAIKEGRQLEHIDEINPIAVIHFDEWDTTVMAKLLEENRWDDIKHLCHGKSQEEIFVMFNNDPGCDSPLMEFVSYIIYADRGEYEYINPYHFYDLICDLIANGIINTDALKEYLMQKMETSSDTCRPANAMLSLIDECLESKNAADSNSSNKIQEKNQAEHGTGQTATLETSASIDSMVTVSNHSIPTHITEDKPMSVIGASLHVIDSAI